VEFQSKIPQQQLKQISGVQEVRHLNGYRYQILADAEKDLRASVFDFAVDQKVKLLEMHKEVFEMDEVFQRLTK